MKDFRDLKVWEKSHKLTLEIYAVTAGTVRSDEPDSSMQRFDRGEHCRGMRKAGEQRIPALPADSIGFG